MSGEASPPSPLEVAAASVGESATETFELLGNETRLAILLALWEAYEPHGDDPAVSFSDLRERVGLRDSGQFNYHLGKLNGQFVESTGEGYQLHPVGLRLVQTVIAGTGNEASLPPAEIDFPCHLCGGQTALTYEDGWLSHVCTECEGGFEDTVRTGGLLFSEPFPPAALSDRTPEEIFAAGVFKLLQVFVMKLGGVCPICSGRVESRMTVCDDHDASPGELCDACQRSSPVVARWRCTVCKYRGSTSPSGTVVLQPDAVVFYHDHGIDLGYAVNDFERAREALQLVRDADETLLSTDPMRVRVTARCDGDELALVLDEQLHAVEALEMD
ncbi:MAG: hypothetical protein ABEH66_02560 [Halobacteriales archaeon]